MNNPTPAGPPDSSSPISTRAKRSVNLRVPADMALYAALAGKAPEIDPTLAEPMKAASVARRENPWSPMVLSHYLREICREKALKMHKPELAGWIRKQSEIARKRFVETQARIHASKSDRAA